MSKKKKTDVREWINAIDALIPTVLAAHTVLRDGAGGLKAKMERELTATDNRYGALEGEPIGTIDDPTLTNKQRASRSGRARILWRLGDEIELLGYVIRSMPDMDDKIVRDLRHVREILLRFQALKEKHATPPGACRHSWELFAVDDDDAKDEYVCIHCQVYQLKQPRRFRVPCPYCDEPQPCVAALGSHLWTPTAIKAVGNRMTCFSCFEQFDVLGFRSQADDVTLPAEGT
jgi:hypothetical protein